MPRRLQQSYYRQVAALPAPTRTFLLVAAAEETGDLGLVRRRGAGPRRPRRDRGRRGRTVRADRREHAGGGVRHPLVRAAVYQGATSAERGAAHAALAAALHDPMGGAPDADRQAWHRRPPRQARTRASGATRASRRPRPAAPRARRRRGRAGTRGTAHPGAADRARRLIAAAGAALDAGHPDAASALAGRGEPDRRTRWAAARSPGSGPGWPWNAGRCAACTSSCRPAPGRSPGPIPWPPRPC